MASLAAHRANFTWALNQYNQSDDPEKQDRYARDMARYLTNAQTNGYKREEITREKSHPSQVDTYIGRISGDTEPELTEEQATKKIAAVVDTSEVMHVGKGLETVYAYGYACCPDRLKIGLTTDDTIQRIANLHKYA